MSKRIESGQRKREKGVIAALLPVRSKPHGGLEVESDNDLDHSSTRIIGGRKILISVRCRTKGGAREPTHAGDLGTLAADLEVDVVEGVQELSPQLEVYRLSNLGLLHEADIKPREAWSVHHQVAETTLTKVTADATIAVRRGDLPTRGCTTGK